MTIIYLLDENTYEGKITSLDHAFITILLGDGTIRSIPSSNIYSIHWEQGEMPWDCDDL